MVGRGRFQIQSAGELSKTDDTNEEVRPGAAMGSDTATRRVEEIERKDENKIKQKT